MSFLLYMRDEGVTKKKSVQSLSSKGGPCCGGPEELENMTETIMFIERILYASYYLEFSICYLVSTFHGALMLVLSLSSLCQTRKARLRLSDWPKDMMPIKLPTEIWTLDTPANRAWSFHLTILHSHFEWMTQITVFFHTSVFSNTVGTLRGRVSVVFIFVLSNIFLF